MISVEEHWTEDAACLKHPFLGPDAWGDVKWGYPYEDGAKAILVCRFVCPVQKQCRNSYHENEMIAGGGWINRRGIFREDPEGTMELHQAAAYIGITLVRLQSWLSRGKVQAAKRVGGHNWLWVADVKELAQKYGPPHGTVQAWQLHQLRGEAICPECVPVAQYADVFA